MLDGYEREGKSMQNEFSSTDVGRLSVDGREWRVRLSQQLNRVLKGIYEALSQAGLLSCRTTARLLQIPGQLPC